MALFKNPSASHEHSLEVLNLIYGYDSFLDSLTTIADMGCGSGLDGEWWATLETRDDPPVPRNYTVYGVDTNIHQVEQYIVEDNPNFTKIEADFETVVLPKKADLIWSHDSLQYARNPLACLRHWNSQMNQDGMLMLSIPQTTYMRKSRLQVENHSNQYYSFNILNLIYMLAVSGFDCRDAYFYRKNGTPWLYAAVYATKVKLPDNPTWYDLAEKNLINDFLIDSVQKNGYARLEDLVVHWLDKENYQITN
jgi:SAM-dependent methyltransferase